MALINLQFHEMILIFEKSFYQRGCKVVSQCYRKRLQPMANHGLKYWRKGKIWKGLSLCRWSFYFHLSTGTMIQILFFSTKMCQFISSVKIVQRISAHETRFMSWFASSTNLNPIENIYGLQACAVNGDVWQFNAAENLQKSVFEKWKKIRLSTVYIVTVSMQKRCVDFVCMKGRKIKY